MMLTDVEKEELLRFAKSHELKNDLRRLKDKRFDPIVFNGKVDLERLIIFLNGFNEFINHKPKPFKPIIDRIMRL